MKRESVLLFDLGGVLVDTAAFDTLKALLGEAAGDHRLLPGGPLAQPPPEPLDDQTARDRWLRSPSARSFELGKTSPEVFAAQFLEEWGLALEPVAFLENLATWIRGPYNGASELISSLRDTHHVSCFSNCNELHWEKLASFLDCFDSAFSSHLLGEIKPDEQAFAAVLTKLEVGPEQVRFFDDSRANVEAAGRLGIRAFLVDGVKGVRRALLDEGLL